MTRWLTRSLGTGLALAGLAAPAQTQAASSLELSAGPGVVVTPLFYGSAHFRYLPIPDLSLQWGDRLFFDGRNGLGLYAVSNDLVEAGISTFFRTGRKSKRDERLSGLPDIDDAAQIKLFGRYRIASLVDIGATVARDLGGSEGVTTDVQLSSFIPFSEAFTVIPVLSTTWASRRFADTWFSIAPPAGNTARLPRYRAGAGFISDDLSLIASYALNRRWTLGGTVSLGYLKGDAARSPITEKRLQPTLASSLTYSFFQDAH